jgi:hypothetical protein
MQQHRSDRRIHAARQAQDDFFVTDLLAYLGHRFVDVIRHVPIFAAAADVMHEATQHRLALMGVRDFRMELQRVKTSRLIRHTGDRRARVAGNDAKTLRQFRNLVAVTHPHIDQAVTLRIAAILNVAEQSGMALRADLGITELAHQTILDRAAQLRRHGLHAVANAQHRHTEFEHDLRCARCLVFINRIGSAGQNDAAGCESANIGFRHVPRMQLAVHMRFTHATRDQLGILRTEIEDEDFFV